MNLKVEDANNTVENMLLDQSTLIVNNPLALFQVVKKDNKNYKQIRKS